MIFKLVKTSEDSFEGSVELKTISQLIKFVRNEGNRIIIDLSLEPTIEIYDDWRE